MERLVRLVVSLAGGLIGLLVGFLLAIAINGLLGVGYITPASLIASGILAGMGSMWLYLNFPKILPK